MNHLLYLEESASTNDDILLLLNSDDQDIFGCYTFNQKKGRGQHGNSWKTEKNLNIAFSLAIPKNFVKISDSLFNFYTALQLRSFVANLTKKEVKIKWPNDLILNQKKIGGVLIEKIKQNSQKYFIVGFGLNVKQIDFSAFPSATSLELETSNEYNLQQVSENLFNHLKQNYLEFESQESIMSQYENHLFRKDQISVFEIDNVRQNGIIKKIDEEGYLYIDLEENGLQKFANKEVKMLY